MLRLFSPLFLLFRSLFRVSVALSAAFICLVVGDVIISGVSNFAQAETATPKEPAAEVSTELNELLTRDFQGFKEYLRSDKERNLAPRLADGIYKGIRPYLQRFIAEPPPL